MSLYDPTLAMLLAIGIPAIGSLLIALAYRWPNLREAITLLTATALFLNVLSLLQPVLDGARPEIVLLSLLPGLELMLSLEPLGMLFALLASGLWIVNSIYSIGYMRGNNEQHQTGFYVCFAIALGATQMLAMAGNLITLLLAYEVLTFATYPLVTHKRTDVARAGGRTYLGILLFTSIALLLPAIVAVWYLAGTTDFIEGGVLQGKLTPTAATVLFAIFLFGTGKAALMPFHRWLPAAMVAPTPVSALLHAVAVVKAGVFTVTKVAVYTFGLDFLSMTGAAAPMLWVAVFTLLTASLIALTKDNLKARLAYSTVSQLSYIVLGATLATSMGVMGGAFHMVAHALGKITLFFCAGAIYTALHKTEVSQLDGMGRVMPFTFGAFLIASLSIIGLPPTGGTWSKWLLMSGAADAGEMIVLAALAISSLLNIVYLLEIPLRAFLKPTSQPVATGINEAPLLCVAPLCLTALSCILLFFYPQPLLTLLNAWSPS